MDLWREFKKTHSQSSRNRLIERYLPIVKYTAERVAAKLPQNVDVDDLMSAGVFGLMDAIDGFCSQRVRGAMLDELRACDWVPRLVRTKATQLEHTLRELEAEHGRPPTDMELAEKLGMSLAELDDMVQEASATAIVSLSEKWQEQDDQKSFRTIDLLEDRKAESPIDELHRKDVMAVITKELTLKERLIVLLYYFEELTMREIGLALDLSESRVCQLHTRIFTRLRAKLTGRQADLA
ncbi:FliA/WhiG family RNA polymerase sigma factor [bacterium]|nr:FliA/WhiG family RNA polymerase sigma factor [bacterium]